MSDQRRTIQMTSARKMPDMAETNDVKIDFPRFLISGGMSLFRDSQCGN